MRPLSLESRVARLPVSTGGESGSTTCDTRASYLHRRTLLSENAYVRGRDFIQRVTELGRERKVQVRVDAKRGKGSHVTLYYGDRKTVVKNRRKEVGPGLQSAMIRQLGLEPSDLR